MVPHLMRALAELLPPKYAKIAAKIETDKVMIQWHAIWFAQWAVDRFSKISLPREEAPERDQALWYAKQIVDYPDAEVAARFAMSAVRIAARLTNATQEDLINLFNSTLASDERPFEG